jgi:ammonium transporter, Amt family
VLNSDLAAVSTQVQTLWTLTSAALVLFMQAGFCCLEAGCVRHKNSINVAIKNVVDLCISFPAFFVVGYALMFGADQLGLYGEPVLFLSDKQPAELTAFVFQAAFCSTSATIVSGGVAERCRFLPYVLVTIAVSVLIYPLFGHSVWGNGLLAQIGYHDFAGSSVVHMVGAGVTLAGIQVLGPRAGRFDADGKPHSVPASSMPLMALGVMILLFGWIGFNGGSAPLGDKTALIIANTMLAGCFGGLAALLTTWAYGGLAAVELILNGLLGGLVAVTACADVVSPSAACMVGILGGVAVVLSSNLLERFQLDDAVGAVPVHGVAGLVGILSTAVFASSESLASAGLSRLESFGVQTLGAVTCALWAYLAGLVVWLLVGRLSPLRVGPVEETVGMNFSEHQVTSPVEALTQSLSQARKSAGRDPEIEVPDGQFEALANAIRELVRDSSQRHRRANQWSQDLDAISGTLDLNQRVGRDAMQTYRDEVVNLDRNLHNIARHLTSGQTDIDALAVAVDSLVNLRRRLHLLDHTLPSALDCWDQVNRMAERLDRLASTIRGEVHEVH